MRSMIRCTVLLTGAMLMMTGMAKPRVSAASKPPAKKFSTDVGITYVPEYARIVNQNCSCFWLQGVSGDASLNFYRGLGVDVDLTDGEAKKIQPNVNLSKLTFAVGPRYTWDTAKWKNGKVAGHPGRIFVQSLFGVVHGYNSVFPANGGSTTTANSYSIQFGGGGDLLLGNNFGLRVVELDWVRTALPNASSNTQDDLRLGFGFSYHFK